MLWCSVMAVLAGELEVATTGLMAKVELTRPASDPMAVLSVARSGEAKISVVSEVRSAQ